MSWGLVQYILHRTRHILKPTVHLAYLGNVKYLMLCFYRQASSCKPPRFWKRSSFLQAPDIIQSVQGSVYRTLPRRRQGSRRQRSRKVSWRERVCSRRIDVGSSNWSGKRWKCCWRKRRKGNIQERIQVCRRMFLNIFHI